MFLSPKFANLMSSDSQCLYVHVCAVRLSSEQSGVVKKTLVKSATNNSARAFSGKMRPFLVSFTMWHSCHPSAWTFALPQESWVPARTFVHVCVCVCVCVCARAHGGREREESEFCPSVVITTGQWKASSSGKVKQE